MDYFITGAISGATGILLSHPIDTIKSNVQDGKSIRYNPRFLFRGIVPPFFGMGLEKAVVFGTYHNVKTLLPENNNYNNLIAGAVAGFASSFVVTPIERLKIMSQVGNSGFRNLYAGLSTTFTREMPGFGVYFTSYEYMKSLNKNSGTMDHFLMGGTSGFLAWFFIYPQDLIKTQIQASSEPISYRTIVKKIYKENGIKGFFRGFHLALLRAVPLHAGTFAMFEFLSDQNIFRKD